MTMTMPTNIGEMAPRTQTESKVDVLIVGAGPAGLMMALWMAKLGIEARVVDKRTDKVFSGQADGLNLRTMEILDSFGIADRVLKEAAHTHEFTFWNSDDSGKIVRSSRTPAKKPGLTRFFDCTLHTLNQGRIEAFFLDAIREASDKVKIERKTMPSAFHIDEELATKANSGEIANDDVYPIEVTLQHLSEKEAAPAQVLSNMRDGMFRSNLSDGGDTQVMLQQHMNGDSESRTETVRAKYLVACDGAHSWVRGQLGKEYELTGESADSIWGVIDMVPITDFPDIRTACTIRSANAGTVMVIPREGRVVRLYIQMKEIAHRGERAKVTPESILASAQRIFHPYTLTYRYIDWWSAYQIGQRVAPRFTKLDRVFLAGDAVHTHSPKAGLGMNTALQDAYNLGWKMGLVCGGSLPPSVLATYEAERLKVARQLVAFDRKFSKMFTDKPSGGEKVETKGENVNGDGVSGDDFQRDFHHAEVFITGVGVRYDPGVLAPLQRQRRKLAVNGGGEVEDNDMEAVAKAATGLCVPGLRLPSYTVFGHADARPWEMHRLMPSDGRFRVLVFGADVSDMRQRERVNSMGRWLRKLQRRFPFPSPSAPSTVDTNGVNHQQQHRQPEQRHQRGGARDIVDVILIHSAARGEIELLKDLDEVYHPFDEWIGWDYGKVFVDRSEYDEKPDGERVYRGYGIDEKGPGAVIVVRPDGHVGLVTSLDGDDGDDAGRQEIGGWFDALFTGSSKTV